MPNVVECSRIKGSTRSADVQLTANAVVFVFHVKRTGKRREDFILGIGRRRQHELHRTKNREGKLVELAAFGQYRSLADIPKNHISSSNGVHGAFKSLRDGFFDRVFFQ